MNEAISFDMFAVGGLGVAALFFGVLMTRLIPGLKKFCIPAPVSGGLLVCSVFLLLHTLTGRVFVFDGALRDICMLVFFTSVGFQCNLKVLKTGGRKLAIMVGLVAVLIILQNLLSIGFSSLIGVNPLVGMAAGSVTLCGGHGTAGGFAPLLEQFGLSGAATVTMAAATFGLVAGSLFGGPAGAMLVRRFHLADECENAGDDVSIEPDGGSGSSSGRRFMQAACQLILALAAGTAMSRLLAKTGITFPTYFGALICAAVLRNIFDREATSGDNVVCAEEINSIGEICLSLFLGMAMSTIKLWELAGLVLPLTAILAVQVLCTVLFAVLAAFPALGKDYDAAVLVSGLCGFGLGATPNAMANMSAVCYKYRYSAKPFIIVPVVGAMFLDIINMGCITVFLNLIK